ncbi:cation:proton antiporter [Anaerosporobacter faecicola]|uniref:cation:proton antiporter n=1 Tax=Anaerosporobacter faecicola TaxID=2718714 RepID=UPI001439128C|nr:cation:proton antiporter [Anaerosporobacter faecicola]
MGTYGYLLDIALILISTKVLGITTKKFQLPQVVGALVAGIVLGPAVLNILKETNFLVQLSEIGVIILMFSAGLEADLQELKKTGKASFIIALFGVIVPLLGGLLVGSIFNKESIIANDATASIFLQNIFMGIILTATSVSITVEALKEMKKLNTAAGNAILGAAIIDDILGIVALTVITSLTDSNVSIVVVLLKIVAFFVCSLIAGFIFFKLMKFLNNRYKRDMRRFVILAFTFCLLMAYCAEEFFGVADITGAFIAGLIISNTERTKYIADRFEVVSYAFLSPIFFASIGLKIVLPKMTVGIILFAVVLTIIAVITKIVGCGLGSKVCGYSNAEAMQIGIGMVSRGEVALIVASKGQALGLMSTAILGPIIIVVVITTVISPILLKLAFKKA